MSNLALAASVVGASGYAGAEVVALLADHPDITVDSVISRTYSGQPFASLYPRFSGKVEKKFQSLEYDTVASSDIVFLAVPHTTSMQIVPELRKRNKSLKIVDLAADYRFNSADKFEEVYGVEHNDPDNVASAAYGLAEYNSDSIKNADLVANPGCYATAVLVPLVALAEENLLDGNVFVDAKSGISGAGRGPAEATTF
ncbi:MAG: N-acetyl-gamma-glutamyl-phosphate reductase, partial [bacterium]